MKTVSHVVVVILILIRTGKASKREVKIKGDLTERIDAMEESMGLLKAGFLFDGSRYDEGHEDKSETVSVNEVVWVVIV